MKQHSTTHTGLLKKYQTLYVRLEKAMRSGHFADYSERKKQQLLHRMQRYERRLWRKGITVAGVATLMLGAPLLQAQGALPVGSEFPVNTYTTNIQRYPSIAVDSDGDFIIAWESRYQDGSNFGIYAQRYASDGSALGSEFPVNSYTTGGQRNPSIGVDNDGDFIIAWHSNQDGSYYGIYAQRYASDGSTLGSEFPVNSYTTNSQINPSIGVDSDGDFIIAWTSIGQDGDNEGIYAQRYASNGSTVGSEFPVNIYTTDRQNNPTIAVDSDGDFIIAWESRNQDGSGNGIYAQRYDNNGNEVGSEFLVNSYTTGNQSNPSIGVDSDGDFIIAWESRYQDGSNYSIYAQRYDNNGNEVGSEFPVNSYTTNSQINPSIGVDSDGDFIIAWESIGQDGSGYGIYAQRYDSNGIAVGSEFQVNSYTTNSQINPSIGVDSDGDFIITWQSNSQDGSNYGIYAQRYSFVSLPVELLHFKGVPIKQGNQLTWATASESQNAGFEIEKSSTGKAWKNIGFVKGAGTTVEEQNYTFLDAQPFSGSNYYRLKQVDEDGAFEYSDVIVITATNSTKDVLVYPNPAKGQLQVQVPTATARLQLYDMLGNLVKTELTNSTQHSMDVQDLPAGIYVLKLYVGQEVITKEVVLE